MAVHDKHDRAAGHEALFDDAGVPVAQALFLSSEAISSGCMGSSMTSASARKPAMVPPTAVARRCPPFVVVSKSSDCLASTVPGKIARYNRRRHDAPRQRDNCRVRSSP